MRPYFHMKGPCSIRLCWCDFLTYKKSTLNGVAWISVATSDSWNIFPLNHKGGRVVPTRSCETTRGAWPGRLSVAEWRHGLPVVVLVATFVRSFPCAMRFQTNLVESG